MHKRRADRRLFAGAGTALLGIAVITAGGILASNHAAKEHHATLAALADQPTPASSLTPTPASSLTPTPASSLTPTPEPTGLSRQELAQIRQARRETAKPIPPVPYGDVISTGIRNPAGELVFYGVRVHLAELPGITFGIMGGYREASGRLKPVAAENEVTAPDDSPGFHAVGAPISVNGQPVPEFGYYAGPAVKITGTAGGRTIQAAHARWSVNPRIVIFWFPPAANPGGQDVTGLAAYDAAGQLLPAGNSQVGHG